jgi:hypothetical protein
VRRGGYSFEFDGAAYNATLKLYPVPSGGGSHDEFWRYFCRYLSLFGNELLAANSPLAQLAVARLSEIQQLIMAPGGKGVWVSFMRNEINYQHKFGVWFPFKLATGADFRRRSLLLQRHTGSNLAIDVRKDPLLAFNAASIFLAALNFEFATLLKARAGSGAKRFSSEWNRLVTSLRIS